MRVGERETTYVQAAGEFAVTAQLDEDDFVEEEADEVKRLVDGRGGSCGFSVVGHGLESCDESGKMGVFFETRVIVASEIWRV